MEWEIDKKGRLARGSRDRRKFVRLHLNFFCFVKGTYAHQRKRFDEENNFLPHDKAQYLFFRSFTAIF